MLSRQEGRIKEERRGGDKQISKKLCVYFHKTGEGNND